MPPPPGSSSDVKFEIVPDAGKEGESSGGDRAGIYKRLQSELVQQIRVGVAMVLVMFVSVYCMLLFLDEQFTDKICFIWK